MCGIAGIIDGQAEDLEQAIIKMRDKMANRGPDDKNVWLSKENGVALGHRRLSILDLTTKGSQPMIDSKDRFVIVHNGEIYNYLEIRKQLVEFGYTFNSQTDTEVILAAYDKWGKDCLIKFNGMFAFAIWDQASDTLFMARDRMGIKPFYYLMDKHRFLFASEVKSILSVMDTSPPLNIALIDAYMSYGYIPGENTLLKGIKRLLPGHYMIFQKGRLRIEKYWDLSFENDKDLGLDHYTNGLKTLVDDSIRLRLRSDVPIGVFLSGGIDSSGVVSLLAPHVETPLKTFSVAYDFGPGFDETNYARIVAKQYQTDHFEYFMTPENFIDFIPDYVRFMDEPVTEAAAISLYYIAKKAKEHVTVILSGEGADEIFGGYDFYFYNMVIERIQTLINRCYIQKPLKGLATMLPKGKIKKYFDFCFHPLNKRYKGISTHGEGIKQHLYSSEFKRYLMENSFNQLDTFIENLFEKTIEKNPLSRMLYFDTKTWLVDDLLIKADRMSMAAALELRVPFLDHRVVEYAAKIPSKYKIRGKQNKYILKKMLEGNLPDQILHRKKMGFPTPLKKMFQSKLFPFAKEVLLDPNACIHQFFCKKAIKNLLKAHLKNQADNHRVLWQLIVLETWLKANT